jgi:type IV pilus assembly protein PilY1
LRLPPVANPPVTTGPTTVNTTPIVTTPGAVVTVDSTHTSNTVTTTTGGSTDTLSDVAMFYYKNDCATRASAIARARLVPISARTTWPRQTGDAAHSYGDSADWQHMTTFTLGLGSSGLLRYDPDYLTQLSGDYFDITNSSKDWPTPIVSTTGGGPANIDDLWHAAVNGRGSTSARATRLR